MFPDGNNDEMAVKTITFMQIYPYEGYGYIRM